MYTEEPTSSACHLESLMVTPLLKFLQWLPTSATTSSPSQSGSNLLLSLLTLCTPATTPGTPLLQRSATQAAYLSLNPNSSPAICLILSKLVPLFSSVHSTPCFPTNKLLCIPCAAGYLRHGYAAEYFSHVPLSATPWTVGPGLLCPWDSQ